MVAPAVLEHHRVPLRPRRPQCLPRIRRIPRTLDALPETVLRRFDSRGRLAVLIGDVRRSGQYTPIIRDILNFPHGQIRSIIIKVQHNCTSDRKAYGKLEDPPIKHEYCVVFKKPIGDWPSLAHITWISPTAAASAAAACPSTCQTSRASASILPSASTRFRCSSGWRPPARRHCQVP